MTKNNPQLTEKVEELEELVQDLKDRVHYLERELDMCVDEQRFERKIRSLTPEANYEIHSDSMGHYKADVEVHPDQMRHATEKVERTDGIEWRVKESREDVIILSVEQGLHYNHR